MYFVAVTLTTVILPVGSIAVELMWRPDADLITLLGKWFVFWGVGTRLLLAGLSQVARPSVTASILGLNEPGVEKIIGELGYANISMGAIGALSLIFTSWVAPAALLGSAFLGLAGIKHAMNVDRGTKESLAMVTDMIVACAAGLYLSLMFMR